MSNISILDCTLRDGGYVNSWKFGKLTINKILNNLTQSNIDVIECGFISDIEYNENKTLFSHINQVDSIFKNHDKKILYVGMIALGYKEIHYSKIPKCEDQIITGIRLTFHQHEIEKAVEYARDLMKKGYKVFMQPVGTITYSDGELIDLIQIINKLNPFAFYIVDTFGTMTKEDLLRMFYLIDHNLDLDINIGFHSHNNLQLSFSNAQELMEINTKRHIIIDSSVFGMGRGAGNLCTELVTQYINENIDDKYDIVPLFEIIDEHLSQIKEENPWGYSAPYYIAAVNNCHPNYASHLMNKQTITSSDINNILKSIPMDKRYIYDKHFIEKLYIDYQQTYIDDRESIDNINNFIKGRDILVLAPGRTLIDEKDKILNFINDKNPIIISINFASETYKQDIIFISNLKRFKLLKESKLLKDDIFKSIVTSNITTKNRENQEIINYMNFLIKEDSGVSDNAGLMLLKLLSNLNIGTLYLAGFDGFDYNKELNYFDSELINNINKCDISNKNESMKKYIKEILVNNQYEFLTQSLYNGLREVI